MTCLTCVVSASSSLQKFACRHVVQDTILMFVFQTKKCTCANILRDVDFIPMDAFHKMFVVRVSFYPKKKYLVVVFSCFSQKHKVRLIDDFTQSGVNHFVTAHEEPSLHTVDIADSTITVWMQICSSNRSPSELIKNFRPVQCVQTNST